MKTKHKDLAEMNLITKATLPLEAIFSVSKLTDEDREARKKFLSGDPKVNGWKIEFDKSLLIKGTPKINAADKQPDYTDVDTWDKIVKESKALNVKKKATWYFK